MSSPSADAFVGRQEELERLKRMLDGVRRSGRGALVSMRGRRRVGKSRLVEEFAQRSECPTVFFTAVQGPGPLELGRFLEAIAASDAPAADAVAQGTTATTWEAALRLAADGATPERPIVIVIDEFPYLVEKDPTIEAVVQLVWDRTFQRLPVLVMLVGSDRTTMRALTDEGRPLYDRAREMVVRPLSPADVGGMLGLDPVETIDAYMVIGGFPVLALEWPAGHSRSAYLAEALTDPTSFLVISAEKALNAEFPGDTHARAVLSAIGGEARSHTRILQRTNLAQTTLDRSLGLLVDKGVVERLSPYAAKASPKNRQYLIADPYLRFWLRFVGDHIDTIERRRGDRVLAAVETSWTSFAGRAVEPIVRRAIERSLPDERYGSAAYVGTYWNRSGSVEVDVVGGDAWPLPKTIDAIGSIKWRQDASFSRRDTAALAAQRSAVPGTTDDTRLVGVSRNGFAADHGLDIALTAEDLIRATPRAL